MRPLHSIIKARPMDAQSERAEWTGASARAKFEGAAQADKAQARAVVFGKRVR